MKFIILSITFILIKQLFKINFLIDRTLYEQSLFYVFYIFFSNRVLHILFI